MRTPMRLILAGLALTMFVGGSSHAATLPPLEVVVDPAADHPTEVRNTVGADWIGDDVTPVGQASDLLGVSIAETDTTIDITWKVFGLDENVYPAAPLNVINYFEFLLATDTASALFSARARLHPVPVSTGNPTGGVSTTYPAGQLQSNCVTANNVVTCQTIPGSQVTVLVDTANETITASIRRQDLKGPGGVDLAVDGASITEAVLFRGIATCTTLVQVTSAAMCDDGEMDVLYTLGVREPA